MLYRTELEHLKGEEKLMSASKFIKIIKNTYGIENDRLIDVVYSELAKYYQNKNMYRKYYEYMEKSIFFINK